MANCDGEREHRYGIRIETLDNPGWLIKIDLARRALKRQPFTEIAVGIGYGGHPVQSHWSQCLIRDGVWEGAADGSKLSRLLELFLDWAEESAEKNSLRASGTSV